MDFRLYYYENGQLKKWSNRKNEYYFTSEEDIMAFINKINERPRHRREGVQWVVTEYSDNYSSKIIKII